MLKNVSRKGSMWTNGTNDYNLFLNTDILSWFQSEISNRKIQKNSVEILPQVEIWKFSLECFKIIHLGLKRLFILETFFESANIRTGLSLILYSLKTFSGKPLLYLYVWMSSVLNFSRSFEFIKHVEKVTKFFMTFLLKWWPKKATW